jgi:hypothetical protein
VPDGDGVVDDHRPLHHGVEREDAGLGLIDDGDREDGAERAGVRDRECPLVDLVGLQSMGSGSRSEVVDGPSQADEVHPVGPFHHGND